MELERLSHGRGANNISDRLPDQGRAKRVPCGGLPKKGWDKDGDEDTFLQPACPGHRDHIGGGKPPTSKVITMRHAGAVEDPKWETSRYRDVQDWGGAEDTANGRNRTTRKHVDGLRGIQETARSCPQFKTPVADHDGRGRRLASGGGKPGEGAEELGAADTDPEHGRGGQADIRDVFLSGGPTGAAVRVGDVGADPTNRKGAGQLHARGRAKDNGETTADRVGGEMVLPLPLQGA